MISNKYVIKSLIGKGKFGKVYSGQYKKTEETVAVKIELSNSPVKLLKNETSILNYLYHSGCRKIPFVFWYGIYESHPCLIMTHYDMTLYDYAKSEPPIDPMCTKTIIIKMVHILKSIHDSHIIHRDIKPQNFMIKHGDLFLVDFGLAAVFIDGSKIHFPETAGNTGILGTPKYMSIYLHKGINASRRDDVISCAYIYLFLILGGCLPWENLPDDKDIRYSQVPSVDGDDTNEEYEENHIFHYKNKERARQKSWDNLNSNYKNRDESFLSFLEKVYGIGFYERPPYENLIS